MALSRSRNVTGTAMDQSGGATPLADRQRANLEDDGWIGCVPEWRGSGFGSDVGGSDAVILADDGAAAAGEAWTPVLGWPDLLQAV